MIPIAQLLSAPDAPTFRAQMVTSLVDEGVPADKWRKGGSFSTILTVLSMVLANLAILVSGAINGFFLPNATGQFLVNLAYYLYGVVVPVATQASGQLTFTNSQGGAYSGAGYLAGQVFVKDSTTGILYVSTQDLALTPVGGAQPIQTIGIQATIFGSGGNAPALGVDTLVTSMLGVSVSNALPIVGIDQPGDAAIRGLCLASLGARSVRSVRGAYQYAIQTALNAVTGQPVNINRWSITTGSHTGLCTVVVASPAGAADPNDVQGVANNIEAVARPGGVFVTTSSAVANPYGGALTLWCSAPSGTSAATLAAAAGNAITAFLANPQSSPIGGVTADDDANPNGFTGIFVDGIKAAAASGVAGAGGLVLSAQGLADLALTAAQVANNAIVVTVRLVASGGSS
jgi:hypothetical protein